MKKILFPYLQAQDSMVRCCIVLWDLQRGLIDKACLYQNTSQLRYVSQERAWHEANEWINLISRFTENYDFLLVLGHGQAHPRFWGLACSIGAALGVKSIGVAHSLLPYSRVTDFVGDLGYYGMQLYKLETRGEQTGFAVLRGELKKGFFYSIGWGVELEELEWIVQKIHRNHASLPFRNFARHAVKTYFSKDRSFSV